MVFGSPRNTVRLPSGISVQLRRNPQVAVDGQPHSHAGAAAQGAHEGGRRARRQSRTQNANSARAGQLCARRDSLCNWYRTATRISATRSAGQQRPARRDRDCARWRATIQPVSARLTLPHGFQCLVDDVASHFVRRQRDRVPYRPPRGAPWAARWLLCASCACCTCAGVGPWCGALAARVSSGVGRVLIPPCPLKEWLGPVTG